MISPDGLKKQTDACKYIPDFYQTGSPAPRTARLRRDILCQSSYHTSVCHFIFTVIFILTVKNATRRVQAQLSLSVIYKPPPGMEAGFQDGGVTVPGADEQMAAAGLSQRHCL